MVFVLDLSQFASLVAISLVTVTSALAALSYLTRWRAPLVLVEPLPDTPVEDPAPGPGDELMQLRALARLTPSLFWQCDDSGAVVWSNVAYQRLADELGATADMPAMFPAESLPDGGTPGSRRIVLQSPEGGRRTFDVTAHTTAVGTAFSAQPADRMVKVEQSLRSFTQTLTNTFAQLSVGLAIFDARRQLVMFNPALADLSSLEPEWLSARPTLGEVLDRLRDRNRLPEPRDYKAWKRQVSRFDSDAPNSTFEEDWTLPGGQCLRVQGRPHHNGGIAFTFEDITAEISLSRRFREDLDLYQAVLDESDQAIALFSATGTLAMSNRAYRELWGQDPNCDPLLPEHINDASALWINRNGPSPLWGEIRDFVSGAEDRAEWTDTIADANDCPALRCRVSPISGGSTLVVFQKVDPVPEFLPRRNLTMVG